MSFREKCHIFMSFSNKVLSIINIINFIQLLNFTNNKYSYHGSSHKFYDSSNPFVIAIILFLILTSYPSIYQFFFSNFLVHANFIIVSNE